MGDDLLDDYWVEEVIATQDDVEETKQSPPSTEDESQKHKPKKKKKKGKTISENDKPVEEDVVETGISLDDQNRAKKSKKKLKRKSENVGTIEEVITTTKKKKRKKPGKEMEEYAPTLDAMWSFFETELKKTLTEIEINDIKPQSNEWFLTETHSISRNPITNFPTYLKDVVPSWTTECETLTRSGRMGSPLMLILTSSAVRAVDLLRHAAPFKGENCKTAKLFAKHFKLDEQSKQLAEKVSHLAVGTPHRVVSLIEKGSLDLDGLRFVVVDWTWRDVKMRGLTNMPMVKEQFVNLFQHYLFERSRTGKLSVGLF